MHLAWECRHAYRDTRPRRGRWQGRQTWRCDQRYGCFGFVALRGRERREASCAFRPWSFLNRESRSKPFARAHPGDHRLPRADRPLSAQLGREPNLRFRASRLASGQAESHPSEPSDRRRSMSASFHDWPIGGAERRIVHQYVVAVCLTRIGMARTSECFLSVSSSTRD